MESSDAEIARASELARRGGAYTELVAEFEPRIRELSAGGLQYLAEGLAQTGRPSEGLSLMRWVLDGPAGHSELGRVNLLCSLGRVHILAGDAASGIAAIDEAIALAPDNRGALMARVEADLDLRAPSSVGLAAAEDLVQLRPTDREALRDAIYLFALAGRGHATEAGSRALLRVDPDDWVAHAYLGWIFTNRLRLLRAVRHIGVSLRLAPDRPLVNQMGAHLVSVWSSLGGTLATVAAIGVLLGAGGSDPRSTWFLIATAVGIVPAIASWLAVEVIGGRGTTRALWLVGARFPELRAARRCGVRWLAWALLLALGLVVGQPLALIGAALVVTHFIASELIPWLSPRKRLRAMGAFWRSLGPID